MATHPRWRAVLAAFLTAGGLTLAAFFSFLYVQADCAAGCVERGEQAVALALVGLGIGLFGAGVLMRRDPRRATAVGLLATGASAAAGILFNMTQGARGTAIPLILAAFALAGVGAGLLRRARASG